MNIFLFSHVSRGLNILIFNVKSVQNLSFHGLTKTQVELSQPPILVDSVKKKKIKTKIINVCCINLENILIAERGCQKIN